MAVDDLDCCYCGWSGDLSFNDVLPGDLSSDNTRT